MLMQLIRATRFRQFSDFVTPAFFDVVPTRALLREARSLSEGYRSRAAHEGVMRARAAALVQSGLGVSLREGKDTDAPSFEAGHWSTTSGFASAIPFCKFTFINCSLTSRRF
ncbi:MAG: hypothetical protein HC923_05380 [Myxococcales bacterium]|nr:hypothetical protein [Myxococcales bacterium]